MVKLLDLPTEILCNLFQFFDHPLDYYHATLIHPQFYQIGKSFNNRYAFLCKILILENTDHFNHLEIEKKNKDYLFIICRFIASASIPISSPFVIDLIELIPTSFFCQYHYSHPYEKKLILQLFKTHPYRHYRPYYQQLLSNNNNHHGHRYTTELTIPTIINKSILGSAKSSNRHCTLNGAPRRVYYHVTLKELNKNKKINPISFYHHHHKNDSLLNNNGIFFYSNNTTTTSLSLIGASTSLTTTTTSSSSTINDIDMTSNNNNNNSNNNIDQLYDDIDYFCMIHDLDKVIVYNYQYECRHGKLWYEDEGIITDLSFENVLEIGNQPLKEMTLSTTKKYQSLRLSPVGYYDYYSNHHHTYLNGGGRGEGYKLKRQQHGWKPCIIATFYNCKLKENVRKGGLKKGDHFDCVFVFEHREDDTLCMEFCQRDTIQKRWEPQGFLLFSEHHIEWY